MTSCNRFDVVMYIILYSPLLKINKDQYLINYVPTMYFPKLYLISGISYC